MSEPQTWAEALKISPEKLSEWSEQAPGDIPLLIWCLQEGQIRAEEYLDWACENFGLPVLNSAFFTQHFDKTTLEQYRKDPNYCAWSFPIAFWDDVLFVACAEPPPEPAMGLAYILADPAAMKEVWATADDESSSGEKKDGDFEMPAGMKPGAGTFVLHLDESTLLTKNHEALDPNPAKPVPEHTGLTLSVVRPTEKTDEKEAPAVLKLETPVAPKGVNFPPAPAEAKKAAASPVREVTATATKTKTEFDPPPAPLPKKSGTRTNISSSGVNEETEVTNAFNALHRDYQTSLVMKCTDGIARPYRWDTQLKIKADDDRCSFNLNFPSFFRIVAKTIQPYHGYVIESPAHKEFFDALGLPALPACVTAIPLATNGVMWGILIAFGGEAAQTGEALAYALGISEKLIKVLEPSMSRAAA